MKRLALAALLAGASFDAAAYSVGSGLSEPCHERMTLYAYQNYLLDFSAEQVPIPPSEAWAQLADSLIDEFDLDAYSPHQRVVVLTMLVGARAPDTDGHAILDLVNTRQLHASPDLQYAHCLRAPEDDGALGDAQAVEATRQLIRLLVGLAWERASRPPEEQLVLAPVYEDYYGGFQVQVWGPGYYLGQAMHIVQDSFSHTLRSDDLRQVLAVMNYLEAIGSDFDEQRDGLAHSDSMDACEGETAPLVNAAREASIEFLLAVLADFAANEGASEPSFDQLEAFLDNWLSYDAGEQGCTLANDYCGSYWLDVARLEQTGPYLGCSTGRGAFSLGLLLSALLLVLPRRGPPRSS